MKSLLIASLVLLLSLGAAAQTTVLKFTQDAEFASLSQNTGSNASFTLQVSRNAATGTTTSASLNFLSFSFASDLSSVTFVQIIGAIPSTAFTGQTINDLVVNFDTSQLPTGAVSQSCTITFAPFSETCTTPAPTGLINVEWKQNGAVSSEVAIIREDTLGALTTKLHQHSDNSSASASGSVFGVTVAPSTAEVGVNHSSTLEVTHN